jgi:hypothetical protein
MQSANLRGRRRAVEFQDRQEEAWEGTREGRQEDTREDR